MEALYKVMGLLFHPIRVNDEKWPNQYQTKAILQPNSDMAILYQLDGEPTFLLLSSPLCLQRTDLQKTLSKQYIWSLLYAKVTMNRKDLLMCVYFNQITLTTFFQESCTMTTISWPLLCFQHREARILPHRPV